MEETSSRLRDALQKTVDVVHQTLRDGTMHHHFQPIWRADTRTLLGFEALARFEHDNPESVFSAAINAGVGVHLDRLSVREALRQGQALPGLLFVNIDPNHMGQSEGPFGSVGHALATYRHRGAVVLELTEQAIAEHSVVEAGVLRMHRRSIALALDDAGTGNSNPERLAWLKPRYVKLAQVLIEEWRNGHPERLLRWIERAKTIGAELIAEGVEDMEWVSALANLGVHYVQGYAMGFPNEVDHWATLLKRGPGTSTGPALEIFLPPDWPSPAEEPQPLLSINEIGDIMYSLWPFPAVIVNSENQVVGMNLRAERHFGTPLEQVALGQAEEVLGIRALEPDMIHVSAVLPSQVPVGEAISQRVLLHRTDGQDVPAHLTIVGIRIGNRIGAYKLFTLVPEFADNTIPALLGRDPLSGLYTRTWWDRAAQDSWMAASGAVVFVDLDGLKQVNDLFGHREGDRLIADAGRLLHYLATEENGVAVRYGGDEFLLVLKNRNASQAAQLAQILLKQFAQFESIASKVPSTFSFGVADFGPGQILEAVAVADRRLYEQKGLMLPSSSGSRLLLTAAGRRALWHPIDSDDPEHLTLDRLVQPGPDPELRRAFSRFASPNPGSSVVEVNAGRGQMAFVGGLIEALGTGGQYLATDTSGAHLRRVYDQWQERPDAGTIHFLRTQADQLPIVSESTDLSICAFALPPGDPEATLREMARITHPNGRVAVSLMVHADLSPALESMWPDEYRPRFAYAPEAFDGIARSLGLVSLDRQSFSGLIQFSSVTELSLWLARLDMPSHRFVDPEAPSWHASRGPLEISYEAFFYLFQCPRS